MMPAIAEEFNGQHFYGAGFYSYLLASLISLILAGAYTDQRGPQKPFLAGILVFVLGLLVSAQASSMSVLILGRALQGLGGGAIHSVVFASVNIAYGENRRRRAISYLTTAWVLPSLIAPALAGYVTSQWHWSYVFWGLAMPALLSGVFVYRRLGVLSSDAVVDKNESGNKGVGRIDFSNLSKALRIAFGVAFLLASISLVDDFWVIPLCALSILVFWRPLLSLFPVDMLQAGKGLSAALSLKLMLVFSFFGAEVFIPLVLTDHYHYSAATAGLVLTTGALSWTLATWIYDKVADNYDDKILLIIGSSFLGLGVLLLWLFLSVLQWASMSYAVWSIAAFGMGLVYPLTMNLAMANTETGQEGKTSTAAGVVDVLGFSLAAGIGGAILNVGDRMGYSVFEAMNGVWLVMALVSLAALYISMRRY